MPKITLVRPDGTRLEATPEQADKLRALGYKEEDPEAYEARTAEAGREEYYSTPTQQIRAGAEGLARGATLGGSDYLFGDAGTKARAEYNPGTAMAAEALGAIGPLLINPASAVGQVASRTPTALLGRGAGKLAEAIGLEGAGTKAIVKGTLEGAGYGGAASINHSYLKGDPLTAEAVMHGMGWGALFGGGLAGLGVGLEKVGAKAAVAAETRAAATELGERAQTVRGALEASGGKAYTAMRGEIAGLNKTITEATRTADALLSGSSKQILTLGAEAGIPKAELKALQGNLQKAQTRFAKASKKGKFEKAEEAAKEYEIIINNAAERIGLTAGAAPGASLKELRMLKTVQKELKGFPNSIEEFARMSDQRAERLFAVMEQAKGLSAFPQLGRAVEDSASRMSGSLGLAEEGVAGLRSTWKAAKEALKQEVKATPGFGAKVVGTAAGVMASKAVPSHPFAAYSAAKAGVTRLVAGGGNALMTLRNGVLGRLERAAASYLPKAGGALKKAGPRLEPLATRLDGTHDNTTKDRQSLAVARLAEIHGAAPGIKDRLFRAVEPIAVTQPELGPGLHAEAIGAFARLRGMMPANPGVVSGLRSIWKPSQLQAAVMGKQLEVFHDPVGVAERMLVEGDFDPIQVKALKELAPATFGHLRVALLEKVTLPGFLDKLTYREQIGLGTMLDIAIHSSMRPGYIASSQQIFLDKNQPLATPSIPGAGNGAGRPAADNSLATQSQRIESR